MIQELERTNFKRKGESVISQLYSYNIFNRVDNDISLSSKHKEARDIR